MDKTDAIWDRFAGGLMLYVDNFLIAKNGGKRKIQPSYAVDYDISDKIIEYLEKTAQEGIMEDIWYIKISSYRNINDIPPPLKELAVQFLPRFFGEFPEYKDEHCLQVN